MTPAFLPHPASYRDPSGFVFTQDGVVYRQVNNSFREDYDRLMNSGCYASLVQQGWLLPHTEIPENLTGTGEYYKTLRPETVPFISYAWEWPFDMLQDAALLTLRICRESLKHDLVLKDATPANIQWLSGKPVFIDTLSFERYREEDPWIAYRQFCECFLSPLLLMHYRGIPAQPLQLAWPEGIPLEVTARLLPRRSRFSFFTWLHIHLHAKMSVKYAGKESPRRALFNRKKLLQLLDSLESLVRSLRWKGRPGTWEHYYEEAKQRQGYVEEKKKRIGEWIAAMKELKTVADTGGNEGEFSLLPELAGCRVITTDFDAGAINNLYRKTKQENTTNILPLIIDLSNPSPAVGVNNTERDSFLDRLHTDLCLALALVHHLAIGKNIPFGKIAEMYARITDTLIIEFVPKDDEKVRLLLSRKKDIYDHYNEAEFREAFEKYFHVEDRQELSGSGRVLYRMKRIS